MQNLYDILGVARNASNKEINAALRQLVRRYSDETALGALDSSKALKFVNHARLTFADPQRRAQYDAELVAAETEARRAAAEQAAAVAAAQAAAERAAAAQIPSDITQFDDSPVVTAPAPTPPLSLSPIAPVSNQQPPPA